MNKGQLADVLVARTRMGKAAALAAVDGVFAEVGEALARGDEVRIPGFGAFVTRSRPARTARNPRTGETVEVLASTIPAFKAGKPLKDAVNASGSS
ncbi:MAG: HU family DNA-binding protein [Rhodospirillaceae bacterium]|nr:HU family DNA-binding protein [Rhodospirillaceae bacterium]